VAAHLEPEILIIDEVLAVGDAQFQRKCLGKMGEVASQGRTVLFVSHNLPAIQAFCQRAIVLKQGQLIFEGTPDEAVVLHLGSSEVTGEGDVDLRSHPNRQTPAARAAFEKLRLLNSEGECTSQFEVGEPIEFEIGLNTQDELTNPAVVLVVSRQGTEICILSSHFMHNEALPMNGRTTLRCRWEPGWLAPGQYAIDRVVLRRHAGGERIDVVTRPLNFEIAETDLYGNGKHVEGNAILVPNGRWHRVERSLVSEPA
jgi:lipopolysaccharide transport system ATP-binding protein